MESLEVLRSPMSFPLPVLTKAMRLGLPPTIVSLETLEAFADLHPELSGVSPAQHFLASQPISGDQLVEICTLAIPWTWGSANTQRAARVVRSQFPGYSFRIGRIDWGVMIEVLYRNPVRTHWLAKVCEEAQAESVFQFDDNRIRMWWVL